MACSVAAPRIQHQVERFGQREHRHRQRDETDPGLQVLYTHGEARRVEQRRFADGRQHQAENGHQQRLGDLTAAGERRDRGQADHHQREILG